MIKLPNDQKIYSLLGLAQRSGRVKSGVFLSRQAILKKKAKLIIIAENAARNTFEQIMILCKRYDVPVFVYGTKENLGRCIGKGERSVICVLDKGFAAAISRAFKG